MISEYGRRCANSGQVSGSAELSETRANTLLDSGAGPSVIDYGSVRETGSGTTDVDKDSRVFGLYHEPVQVIDRLDLVLHLGDSQVLEHTFDVLRTPETTCILGRDLLMKFGAT